MKTLNAKSLNLTSRIWALTVLIACSLALSLSVQAYEDPPGCSLNNGGNGASFQSGIDFRLAQAHLGDSVPVFPMIGMDDRACRAVHVTGEVYTATGKWITFLKDASLYPGIRVIAPAPPCEPGSYTLLITPALIGAGVSSSYGSVEGQPKAVRIMQKVDGTVLTGGAGEPLGAFHTATIEIVTPEVQVVQQCAYPQGQMSFELGRKVEFTGYVTNSGDITLTNVVVTDRQGASVQLFNPADGLPFPANVTLPPGAHTVFTNSFMPTSDETAAGSAISVITVTAQDTTEIGGPNALVTNSTTSSAICGTAISASPLPATLTEAACNSGHQFRFNVAGQVGARYAIQAASSPNSANWVSLHTNTAPFTFTDETAALYPTRFYRAIALP